MDDRYCPACRQIYSCRHSQSAPTHCRACLARRRIMVALLALDQLPAAAIDPGPVPLVGTAGAPREGDRSGARGGGAAHD
jgi:hypothetical protein